MQLSDPVNANFAPPTADLPDPSCGTGKILPILPHLTIVGAKATEGEPLNVEVRTEYPLDCDAVVVFGDVDGTAIDGKDFVGPGGQFTIPAGSTDVQCAMVVPTLVDGANTGSLEMGLDAYRPDGIGAIWDEGTGEIDAVHGSLTIFDPAGNGSSSGSELVGDYAPMEARLLDPAAVDGLFALDYNADYFKITEGTPNGTELSPGDTFAPDTGGTPLFVWGLKELDANYDGTINLLYEGGSGGAGASADFAAGGAAQEAQAAPAPDVVATVTNSDPKLNIWLSKSTTGDTRTNITNGIGTVLAGEEADLYALGLQGESIPSTLVHWSFPDSKQATQESPEGDYVKGFDGDNDDNNQISEFSNNGNDYYQNPFKMYWVSGTHAVNVYAHTAHATLYANATISVQTPPTDDMEAWLYTSATPGCWFTFNQGKLQIGHGMEAGWIYSCATPENWNYCFVQIVKQYPKDPTFYTGTPLISSALPEPKPTPGYHVYAPPYTGLDSEFPYDNKQFAPGQKAITNDSPGVILYKGNRAQLSGEIVGYYMCQPTAGGIWVPVGEITWTYFAQAEWPINGGPTIRTCGTEGVKPGDGAYCYSDGQLIQESFTPTSGGLYDRYKLNPTKQFPTWPVKKPSNGTWITIPF